MEKVFCLITVYTPQSFCARSQPSHVFPLLAHIRHPTLSLFELIHIGTVAIDKIPNAINNGLLTQVVVDTAFGRLFRIRIMLGQFDPPTMVKYNCLANDSSVEGSKHRAVNRRIAGHSIGVYENQYNVLRLDPDTVKSIVVIDRVPGDRHGYAS